RIEGDTVSEAGFREKVPLMTPLQIERVSLQILRRFVSQLLLFRSQQLDLQRAGDALSQLALDGKNIFELAGILITPTNFTGLRVAQPYIEPQLVARFLR